MPKSQLLSDLRTFLQSKGHPALMDRTMSQSGIAPDFRVMQFNILAAGLAHPSFSGLPCGPEVLEWSTRRAKVLEEILVRDPDLIALEEVDDFEYFESKLQEAGYEGFFDSKPFSPCLDQPGNIGPDGNAVFYRKDLFSLLKNGRQILKGTDGRESNQTVVWVRLMHKPTKRNITFLVTHLKAKESMVKLRATQTTDLLSIIDKVHVDGSLICGGDFNGDPQEPLYASMSSRFKSAYAHAGSEPGWTTWKIRKNEGEKRRTIDYIWHSEDLGVVGKLEIPETLGEGRLPCMEFPSDHIDLMAAFAWHTK